jgi:hypothetical protein
MLRIKVRTFESLVQRNQVHWHDAVCSFACQLKFIKALGIQKSGSTRSDCMWLQALASDNPNGCCNPIAMLTWDHP